MGNLIASNTLDDVYQLEKTDPVLGGPGGISNRQAQQLLNRTEWLKSAIEALESGGGPFDYNASGGLVPTHTTNTPGGSGVAGAILRKDQFVVTVAGVVGGIPLQIGDSLIAKQDAPTLITHYVIIEGNAVLATATTLGLVKLGQDISVPGADITISIAGLITLFAQLNSPAFTGNPTVPDQVPSTDNQRAANTKFANAAVAAEAVLRTNGDSANTGAINGEIAARIAADATLQTNINNEIANRITDVNTEEAARIAAVAAEVTNRGNADAALQNNINALDGNLIAWSAVGITYPAGWSSSAGAPLQYRKIGGIVYLRGRVEKSTTPTSGETAFTLPAAACPLPGRNHRILMAPQSVSGGIPWGDLSEFGGVAPVTIWEQGKTAGVAQTNSAFWVDTCYDVAH